MKLTLLKLKEKIISIDNYSSGSSKNHIKSNQVNYIRHMLFTIKKVAYTFIFNFTLFLILMIGIQNSSNKSKVNFLINETVKLPISFIIGSSFICGSVIGSFFTINLTREN